MNCSKCGAPLADGTMFCGECGTPVAAPAAAPVAPVAPAPVAPAAPVYQQPMQPQQQYAAVDAVKPVMTDFLNIFLTAFTKPMAAFKDVLSGRKLAQGYILGGVQILVAFLTVFAASSSAITGLWVALLTAGAYAAMAFATSLVMDKNDTRRSFPALAAAFSAVSVYGICACIVGMLLAFANGTIGTMFFYIGIIIWLLICAGIITDLVSGTPDQKLFKAVMVVAAVILTVALVYAIIEIIRVNMAISSYRRYY